MPNLHDQFWSTQKDLQWEKCSRFLLTLESAALLDLQECVKKIANNIIANPREPKYARLRYENETLQAKIFRKNGGLAIMRGFGFEFEDTSKIPADKLDGQKYLVLSPDALSGLPACVQWLDETVETALSFIAAKHEEAEVEAEAEAERQRQTEGGLPTTVFEATSRVRVPMPDIPAQALISIELPTRERVLGGFCLGDTVYGVRRFAAAFFRVQRVEDIILRLPEDLQFDLDAVRVGNNEDTFDATLEETNWPTLEDMQWYPRMRILAYSRVATKTYANDDAPEQQFGEARLVQAHLQRHTQAADAPSSAPLNAFSSSATTLLTPNERAERVRTLQAQVRANQLQAQKEREDAVRNFHEDRERVKKVRPTIPLKDAQEAAEAATSPTAMGRLPRMALWRRRPAAGTSASAPTAASKSSSSPQQPRTRR